MSKKYCPICKSKQQGFNPLNNNGLWTCQGCYYTFTKEFFKMNEAQLFCSTLTQESKP